MRTDDPRAASSTRLRDGAGRAWRRVAGLDSRLRLVGVIGLAAVVALAYYAANPSADPTPTTWLFDGPGLTPEDARRAVAALAVARIPATTGPRGQIAVPASRREDALAYLAKQKLLPKSLRERLGENEHISIFAPPFDRNDRRDEERQREAELIIAGFDGIESAYVGVYRAPRAPGQRMAKVGALVQVQPRDGRPIPMQTLQAIQSLLKSTEPDLPPDALTILDKSGRQYLVAGNPEAGAAMMAHAREEELEGKILAEFTNWIDGIRVRVAVDAAAPTNRPAAPPTVVVNAPVGIESTPEPVTTGGARILVQVPNTHYLHAFYAKHRREATRDELNVFVPKVDETIRSTIHNVVPASEIASLRIDRIDAVGPLPPPVVVATSPRAIVLPQWVIPAASGAAIAMVLLVLIGTRWMIAARRPIPVPSELPRPHLAFDAVDTGPSGRVRELVRRDPAAAAGVLGRWIGQGGAAS